MWSTQLSWLSNETKAELEKTARAIVADGKGILAADESNGTMGKRLANINVPNEENNRRVYRGMLFDNAEKVKHAIGGVILFEETLFQKRDDGTRLVQPLLDAGIIIGIKVDKGVVPFPGCREGEVYVQGIDGLGDRLVKYKEAGCRFAKWRGVLKIGADTPSTLAIQTITRDLARYAAVCQKHGIVPIVEPEILPDGDHSIEVCQRVTEQVLSAQYNELIKHNVHIDGTLLKPNMVTSGMSASVKAPVEEIAWRTVRALQRGVPSCMPGVVFLSGGQSEQEASRNLDALNRIDTIKPWKLSFSFGRALQASALKAWGGKSENLAAGGEAFVKRANANGLAAQGRYEEAGETAADSGSLHVPNHVY